MDTKLIVDGMHCNACVALIKMEIEEVGLANKVKSINLMTGVDRGEIVLEDASQEEVEKIVTVINNLDSYSIQK